MTAPQRHDCAVAFCCDAKFFPFALFTIWQIAHHNPFRKFDFVISTQDDLEIPDWAKSYGIVLHKAGLVPIFLEVARFHGSLAPLFRIMLARVLGDRYRRILYLDCDLQIEGGDINRLLEVDLGPHPIGAALDGPFFFVADFRAEEFVTAGLPAAPYANTGVQVIDTRAYRDQEVERRSFEMAAKYPKAVIYTDQSLTNLALRGGFAQLAPCWNWQLSHRYPLVPMRYPVFVRHFVGGNKPDRKSPVRHEARFNLAYHQFFTTFMPDMLLRIAPPGDPSVMTFKDAARIVLLHVMGARLVSDILARYPDPYKALV